MSEIYVGRVIKVHQHDNSLDIQLSYDDSVLTGVPLLSPMITTSSGVVNMHHAEGNTQDGPGSKTRDITVIVARTPGGFIALGFISPQVSQMSFDRENFKIDRHASDVYQTIDKDGNAEFSHPSGTFIRIAKTPEHEDLKGKDADGLWGITRNKTAPVWMSITVANAGKVKTEITIDPSGNVILKNEGTLKITTKGAATIKAASLTINGPTTINGDTSITGRLKNNGVNVGSTHIHPGVLPGVDYTQPPGE